MKILFAARMARWDLLRATQSLASRVTKWSSDCDLGLHRLVCYINSSLDTMMSGFIGDSIMDCRLWLFSDSDFAGEYDSKSTTGCARTQHVLSPQRLQQEADVDHYEFN